MEKEYNSDSEDSKEFDDEKYIQKVSYRGYTIHVEYNSEGVYYNYQNFENNVLNRAIRFIGGGAMYIVNPILGGTEMVAAVLSDVFVKEGYELAQKLKKNQTKLYNIDIKLDATVLSRAAAAIKYGINCLKEYLSTRNEAEFREFYKSVFQSLEELASFLTEKAPVPSFMNTVSTLTKLVEEGCRMLNDTKLRYEENQFKFDSILTQIDQTKLALAKQWVRCLKYYRSQINFGRKKIKGFFNRHIEYYAEDKMHGIAFRIYYKPPLVFNPKELPDQVLKKYVECVHADDHIIKECSLTYEYVKDKMDQDKYPPERYLYCSNREETGLMRKLMAMGKLLEDAARFDDLFDLITTLVEQHERDVSWNVKEQLEKWFSKIVEPLVDAWDSVNIEENDSQNSEFKHALTAYKSSLAEQLIRRIESIILFILETCLPRVKTDESEIFYYQLILNYSLFKIKYCDSSRLDLEVHETDEIFKKACEICTKLKRCHPYTLKINHQYSKFLAEHKYDFKNALKLLQKTLKNAEDDLDDLKPDQKKEAVSLIKHLDDHKKYLKGRSCYHMFMR